MLSFQDIVSENPHFDIDNFIVLLRNSIYTNNGFAKTFLVSWVRISVFWFFFFFFFWAWPSQGLLCTTGVHHGEVSPWSLVCVSHSIQQISFLDSIPDMHMHEHLPEFLDGLFSILGDSRKEIKKM